MLRVALCLRHACIMLETCLLFETCLLICLRHACFMIMHNTVYDNIDVEYVRPKIKPMRKLVLFLFVSFRFFGISHEKKVC
jgi:hypothetical protein